MALLTKKQILEADDLSRERVPVPEWGGDVFVKSLTGSERDTFEGAVARVNRSGKNRQVTYNVENIRARLCALTIVDDKGVRMFTDAEIGALGKKSAAALNRVFEVAQRLSGLTDDDIEALEKNSSDGQPDDSHIG